jgi:hypothetical protein
MLAVIFFTFVHTASTIVVRPPSPSRQELPHTYLIQFRNDTPADLRNAHLEWIRSLEKQHERVRIRHVFSLAFDGYSANLNEAALDKVCQKDEILSIDHVGLSPEQPAIPDHFANHIDAVQRPSIDGGEFTVSPLENPGMDDYMWTPLNHIGQDSRFAPDDSTTTTTHNKGWNANRVSHRNFSAGYGAGPWVHDSNLGQGVNIYVLDTSINTQQPGFQGSNVSFGANFVGSRTIGVKVDNQDNHGHGTMCAGVIAGGLYGLAPDAHTIAVKIADDNNRSACDDVVAGIEWVLTQPGSNSMKVISMSHYGFTGKPDVSAAVSAAIAKGIHFVVCAGNDSKDSCKVQPANAKGVIAVGSINGYNRIPVKGTSDAAGKEMESTNIGECITVFAPGTRVPSLSTKNLDPNYQYFSWGTSVAAPQVAAIVANRLSAVGEQTPAQIKAWLQETATKGQIEGDLKGAPNLIAYNGAGDEILREMIMAPKKRERKGRMAPSL